MVKKWFNTVCSLQSTVSRCFKQHRVTQFSDSKLESFAEQHGPPKPKRGRLSCKHFEPGIFGHLNRLCSTDLHSHPSRLDQKTLSRWYPPSQGIAISSCLHLLVFCQPLCIEMTERIKWWCEPLAHLWCTLPLFHAWWPGHRALLWSSAPFENGLASYWSSTCKKDSRNKAI